MYDYEKQIQHVKGSQKKKFQKKKGFTKTDFHVGIFK